MDYTSPGLVEEIITELEELLKLEENINDFVLWMDYGNALMNAFRYEKAVECYKKSLSLGESAKVHLNLGMAFKASGRYEEALKEFTHILAENNYADVHYRIADCYKAMGKVDEAMSSYLNALQINPSYVEALYSLAELYRQMGMLEETINLMKKIIDDNIILKQDFIDLTLVHYDLAYLYTKKISFWRCYQTSGKSSIQTS